MWEPPSFEAAKEGTGIQSLGPIHTHLLKLQSHYIQRGHPVARSWLTSNPCPLEKEDHLPLRSLKVKVLVAESCLTLQHMEDRPPGSSVHGILQVRILEWVVVPFFRGSSWSGDQIQVSSIAGGFFTIWATKEAWAGVIGFCRPWIKPKVELLLPRSSGMS